MSLTIEHGDAIIGARQNQVQIDFALVGAASCAKHEKTHQLALVGSITLSGQTRFKGASLIFQLSFSAYCSPKASPYGRDSSALFS